MDNYKYTLDKIIGHLAALEEHFETNACWAECIPKHISVLKVYLQEMIVYTLNSPNLEYWNNFYKEFDIWANNILPLQELSYISYVRNKRKEIVEKFWIYGGKENE